MFAALQAAIEALDRAIDDEQVACEQRRAILRVGREIAIRRFSDAVGM
jgi:hypothetical protein